MKRKLVVILAADIVGYSRLVADDEEEAVHRLASYRAVVDDFVLRFSGRIFNTAGDAVLAEFPSAVDAVRCAVDIQESLRTRNLAYPTSRRMSYRMGITIGDVMERDGDLLGEGVNIAARLESVAPPGGICVSRSVHEAVANKLSIRFFDQGEQQLKNMPDRVRAFTIVFEDKSQPGSRLRMQASKMTSGWRGIALAIVTASGLGALVAHLSGKLNPISGEQSIAAHPGTTESVSSLVQPHVSTKRTETGTQPATVAAEIENSAQAPDAPSDLKASPTPRDQPAPVQPSIRSEQSPASGSEAPVPAVMDAHGIAAGPLNSAVNPELPDERSNARPDPLTTKLVLQRHWRDCIDGDLQQALTACQPIVDGKLIEGSELARFQIKYGRALRDNQQLDKAIEAYSSAIQSVPSAEAYHNRAIAYHDKGDWERSIADYTDAIRLDSNSGQTYNDRAWTRFQSGNAQLALTDADIAVRMLPGKANVWDTRGHIHEALGNRDDAVRDFRKALSLSQSSETSRAGLNRLGASP